MQKLRKGLSFMINRKLAGASPGGARRLRRERSDVAALLTCNRKLLVAGGWSELLVEKKADGVDAPSLDMLNRELSRGWGAWSEMAASAATFMQKLRKGLSFMLNRKLAKWASPPGASVSLAARTIRWQKL